MPNRVSPSPLQRPSAKDLLKHQFIRRAKRTTFLQDLIDRYKRWRAEKGNQADSDSDSDEYDTLILVAR